MAGIGAYDSHRTSLYVIAVSPALQSSGIRRALVDIDLTSLHTLACSKVNLNIRGDNCTIVAIHNKLGFQIGDKISMGIRLNKVKSGAAR